MSATAWERLEEVSPGRQTPELRELRLGVRVSWGKCVQDDSVTFVMFFYSVAVNEKDVISWIVTGTALVLLS